MQRKVLMAYLIGAIFPYYLLLYYFQVSPHIAFASGLILLVPVSLAIALGSRGTTTYPSRVFWLFPLAYALIASTLTGFVNLLGVGC